MGDKGTVDCDTSLYDELTSARSLLALSLILSMLLFKPAPMYILDEIDAALDLSHTQNIGQMLRNHFPQSQFVVVSLKEGMFNNANVLFKTSFENGVSRVTRTVPSKRPPNPSGSDKSSFRSTSRTAESAPVKRHAKAPLEADARTPLSETNVNVARRTSKRRHL